MKTLTITYHDGETVEYEGQSIEINRHSDGGLSFSIVDDDAHDTLHVAKGAWRSYEVNGEADFATIMAHASARFRERSRALADAHDILEYVARGKTPEEQGKRMERNKGDLMRHLELVVTPFGGFTLPVTTPPKEEPAPSVAT